MATVERDGVRLTIELERNPMPSEGGSKAHIVEVDGRTGARIGWVERPWDLLTERIP